MTEKVKYRRGIPKKRRTDEINITTRDIQMDYTHISGTPEILWTEIMKFNKHIEYIVRVKFNRVC